MTTYTKLKSDVALWLDDSQHEARVDTWIGLCEAKLNRELRVREMVCEAQIEGTSGQEYYTLPSDYLALRNITINGYDVDYLSPEQMGLSPFTSITSKSRSGGYYTLESNRFKFLPPVAEDDDIRIHYYTTLNPIGALNETNWLLTKYYDVYLYGVLTEAFLFLYDNEKMGQMSTAFNAIVNQLNTADKQDRWSGSSLSTRYQT